MESWNNIINAALLGTEKKALRKEEMDAVFAPLFEAVERHTSDKEEIFLQTAAFVYNYRQCGAVPLKKEAVSLPVAEAEEKDYASMPAHAVFKDLVDGGSSSLLQFWLEQCSTKSQLVQPGFLPVLFAAGVKTKSLQPLIKAVGGRRGEWLTQFNEEWKWSESSNSEEVWQTGSAAQRKSVLARIRNADPAKARDWLQQTWPQENAAAKEALLEEMRLKAGDEDVDWLESLLNEKSVKVKEAALQVLKTIPSSSIVQAYRGILKQSTGVTASRGVLGFGAKTLLSVKLADVDPAIFKTGIESLSNDKTISDDVFVLAQLTAAVPPKFWEEHFKSDKRNVIELFSKDPKHKPFIAALGKAAARFNDIDWLREVIAADESGLYPEALPLLLQKEAETYALKFFDNENDARNVVQSITVFNREWSLPFAKAVLRFTAKSPYQYNAAFYNNIASLLPVPVVGELEKCTPKEEHLRHMWSNLSEHIVKLLTLKIQTLKAFNE